MRTPSCWYRDAIAGLCDADLELAGGRWTCPHGHRLRLAPSRRVDTLIGMRQGTPGLLDRVFEPKGDRG